MALTKERKLEIIKTYGRNEKDTGLTEVQIALLTEQIKILSDHMVQFKKDAHNKKSLLRNIADRRKLLQYLHKEDFKRYKEIITKLNLRK
jgi:small subunit ribosomal protein S15